MTICWHGGAQTQGEILRPVARLDQLSYYPALCQRVRDLVDEGLTTRQITERINAEGFRPPKRVPRYTVGAISSLRSRLGLVQPCRQKSPAELERKPDEWLLAELAAHLDMPRVTLHHWIRRGMVQARQPDGAQGRWLIWADAEEVARLQKRRAYPWSRPKPRTLAAQEASTLTDRPETRGTGSQDPMSHPADTSDLDSDEGTDSISAGSHP